MRAPLVNFRRFQITAPWPLVWTVTVVLLLVRSTVLAGRFVVFALRHWRSWPVVVLVLLAVDAYRDHGWWPHLLVLVVVAATGAVWWWRGRDSFRRLVVLRAVSLWRRLLIYRRQWHEVMSLCGLVKKYDGGEVLPRLLSVRCTDATDELVLRMPKGQNPEVYHKAARDLAYSFGTRHCRVFSGRRQAPPARSGRLAWLLRRIDAIRFRDRPRHVWLVFIRRDPLTRVVAPLPVPVRPDFTALPLGLREDLATYCLRLLATHVLIGGATRMGKGSVIWSLLRALAAGIRIGLVRVWAIDPKGGMELAIGRPLFSRYVDDDWSRMADLLEDAVARMRVRQQALRGKVRVHTPTVDEPLIVIVIDELAALIAFLADSDIRVRITQALGLLLSQGAGLGVLVVAATQDPRKEVVTVRDYFPTRIALGLTERGHVDMLMGDGARDRGALADQIPLSAKGVAYVLLDGQPEPARVRFSYIADDVIRDMAATFAAPPDIQPEPEPVPAPVKPARTNGNGRHTFRPTPPRQAAAPLLPPSLLNALDLDATRNGGEPR
ncbi:DNA segregation ATPase FtsK/SpoIIIE, S-DNA-T family [Micromonospora pattaloongensis]|uniref:DNA segregation ATPase FtsK/SpoIIIE, S-DNA-T family n=1 Tax=Micromonospora pattaloongensis TaxID=405436 RepID=A0A1H3JX02_9ACTN|nr:FtsK/SpoIIIE domain-containing protein [Micromonospora pattaloongensis]SDY44456.1 DNA segregation ATPase FtsK/SpoIIIE, S-DNA-T family [Micromonospora pattaloongensis]